MISPLSKKTVVQLVSGSPVRRAVLLERLERAGVDASALSPEVALEAARGAEVGVEAGAVDVLLIHTDVPEADHARLRAAAPAAALVAVVRSRGDQLRHESAAIDEHDLVAGLDALLTGFAAEHPLGRLHHLARLVQAELGMASPPAIPTADQRPLGAQPDAPGTPAPGTPAPGTHESGAHASGAHASGAHASGAHASGAHASGDPASGAPASGDPASGASASLGPRSANGGSQASGTNHGHRTRNAATARPAHGPTSGASADRLALLHECAERDDYPALLGLGSAWSAADVEARCAALLRELANLPCVVRGDHERLRFVQDAVEGARCALTDPELRQAWLDGRGPRHDGHRPSEQAP